jgi:hypothetical protein
MKTTINAELAEPASFDRLRPSAHGEPFDSSLILSQSKDEHLAEDRHVEPMRFPRVLRRM